MFAWFYPDRYDLFLLSLLAGGMTAVMYTPGTWHEKSVHMFAAVSFSFFTLPAICLLLNWATNMQAFTTDAGKLFLGYVFTLGGNYLVEKIMAWWKNVSLADLVNMILRRRAPEKEPAKEESK